jgi:hypothetical protein
VVRSSHPPVFSCLVILGAQSPNCVGAAAAAAADKHHVKFGSKSPQLKNGVGQDN